MRKIILVALAFGVIVAIPLVLRTTLSRSNQRLAELQRTCEELREQLQARDQTISELQSQFTSQGSTGATQATIKAGTNAVTEADIQRRMAQVTALHARAAELVEALVAMREAPEAVEIPEHLERAQISLQVYEKNLEDARAQAATLATQAKDLLISLNVPRDAAQTDTARALASLELQPYWPYFEARRELESQNLVVERLRIRLLQERIEAEVLEAQKKAAAK